MGKVIDSGSGTGSGYPHVYGVILFILCMILYCVDDSAVVVSVGVCQGIL